MSGGDFGDGDSDGDCNKSQKAVELTGGDDGDGDGSNSQRAVMLSGGGEVMVMVTVIVSKGCRTE